MPAPGSFVPRSSESPASGQSWRPSPRSPGPNVPSMAPLASDLRALLRPLDPRPEHLPASGHHLLELQKRNLLQREAQLPSSPLRRLRDVSIGTPPTPDPSPPPDILLESGARKLQQSNCFQPLLFASFFSGVFRISGPLRQAIAHPPTGSRCLTL